MSLESLIKQRICILDGGMGTMIQKRGLNESDYRGNHFSEHKKELKGNNDVLSVTCPDVILDIHRLYLEAGADIISTNSFSANRISQTDYDLTENVSEINIAAARNARKAIAKYELATGSSNHFVAGSMGPTNRSLSISANVNDAAAREVSFDEMVEAYSEQADALIEGGVDILLIETVFDPINCKAALIAIDNIFRRRSQKLPVMVSVTLADTSGRLLSGQSLEAFLIAISHFPLFSLGLNCGFGAEQLCPFVEELAKKSPYYVSAHPNAGLPNEFGEYDQTPDFMAEKVENYLENGWINIVGGCCGTTPDHIRAIAERAKRYKPHVKNSLLHRTTLSGLEPLIISQETNFVNIGERTNVAGSAKFARLIREERYDEALDIAYHQVEGGAQIIDVCMDEAMLDSVKCMSRFLNLIMAEPDIARLPVMIDSSNWEVIEAGLKCVEGKAIVNSISLKEGEELFLKRAEHIHRYGAAAVVMLFDENGQADTFEKKIAVARRSYDLLVNKITFPPEDIIFDPNVLSIATGIPEHDNYAVDFIKAVSWIHANLPYAKVSGGISNLSFSFRGNNVVREAMHSVFLFHAIASGLDMGIVNPGLLQVYSDIEPTLLRLTEDVVLNRSQKATEQLIALAETLKGDGSKKEKEGEWRKLSVEERIKYALIRGIDEFIVADVDEARKSSNRAVDVIEGALMDGINEVGILFGDGKMFLPQVIKSARVMKRAVETLTPYIAAENKDSDTNSAGKILLATVKGDVHDIGKNILNVILSCNNYEVIDLGVMVPCEEILETARKERVDFIGLSGLITPSLREMEHVAKEMERQGFDIPLLVGGATTSEMHTAIKIAPLYSGVVIHTRDASQVSGILSVLKSKERKKYADSLNEHYEQLRQLHIKREETRPLLTIEEARQNCYKREWSKKIISKPKETGLFILKNISTRDLQEYIDWTNYFYEWDIKGSYPQIFNDKEKGNEARQLFDNTLAILERAINANLYEVSAVCGIYRANSADEDILLFSDCGNEIARFSFPRQLTKLPVGKPNLSLADFIAPLSVGFADYIALFAVTVKIKQDIVSEFATDDYTSLVVRIIENRFAEAAAEWLHKQIRCEYWGFGKREKLSIDDLFNERYCGIRSAPGYPACPNHSLKSQMFDLLKIPNTIDIQLTETFAMNPLSSVCGFVFSNPDAVNFSVGRQTESKKSE